MSDYEWMSFEKIRCPMDGQVQIVYHEFDNCSFLVVRTWVEHDYGIGDFEMWVSTSIVLTGKIGIGTVDVELRCSIMVDTV